MRWSLTLKGGNSKTAPSRRLSRRRTSLVGGRNKRETGGDDDVESSPPTSRRNKSKRRTGSNKKVSDLFEFTQRATKEASEHAVSKDLPHTRRMENAVVVAFRESLLQSVFVSHVRRESNFLKSNLDPELKWQPPSPPERSHYTICFRTLMSILTNSYPVLDAIYNSFAIAFIAVGFSNFVWYANIEGNNASRLVFVVKQSVRDVLQNFRFFPAFLLLGLLSFIVSRWREFLVTYHVIQARIQDVAVSVGAAVIRPNDIATLRKLYLLYRYLNVAHSMTYANVNNLLPQYSRSFVPYGLLKEEEAAILEPADNK